MSVSKQCPSLLRAAGENAWVVLTKDKNIRYHSREKATLLAHRGRAFVLTARGLNADEMAAIFVQALPNIAKILENNDGPFVATITAANGEHALVVFFIQ